MIEINLIPDIKQELLRAQRIRSTVIISAIIIGLASVGIVVALAIYVFGIQTVRSGFADNAINEESAKLSNVEDLSKMLTIQNQLAKISDLNANKKIGPRIVNLLTTIIPLAPNNVQISDFEIDTTTNTITINGQAENGYMAVEIFKKTVGISKIKFNTKDNNDYQTISLASNISTSNTSYGEDSTGKKVLRFTISFEYAPELLSPISKNLSIYIAAKKDENVTDSFLGLPKSIFTDPAKDIDQTEGQ